MTDGLIEVDGAMAVGDITEVGDAAGATEVAVVFKKLWPISREVLAGAFTGSGRGWILLLLASKIALTFSGGNFFNVSSKSPGFTEAVDTVEAAAVVWTVDTGACDITVVDITAAAGLTEVGDVTGIGEIPEAGDDTDFGEVMGAGDVTGVVDTTDLGAVVSTTVAGDIVLIADLDAGDTADVGDVTETGDITGTVDLTVVGDDTTGEDVVGGGDFTAVGEVTDTGDLAGDLEPAIVVMKLWPNSTVVLLTAGIVFADSGRDCILMFLAASIAFAFPRGNFFRISSRSLADPTETFDIPVVDDVTGACEDFAVDDVIRGGDVTFVCATTDDVVATVAGCNIAAGDFTVVVVVVATAV